MNGETEALWIAIGLVGQPFDVEVAREYVNALAESASIAEARVEALESFVVAVQPFVRDVLDKPFPWEEGGQVVVWMQRWKYDEAVAARAALSSEDATRPTGDKE